MNADAVTSLARATLDGSMPFSWIVGSLMAAILGRQGDQHVEWFPGARPREG